METQVTIVQDTRRAKKVKNHSSKKEEIYPVKLRIYSPLLQKAKMYSTGYDMTTKEFESVWQTEKPRKIHQEKRDYLDSVRVKAVEAAKNCDPFSFKTFEKKLLRRKGDGKNVFYHFEEQTKLLKELGRYSTAESYELSLKSIKNYLKDNKKSKQEIKEPTSLSFNAINELFLKKYETYMLNKGKSKATIGIYLRNLRSIFNIAIKQREVSEDIYPFGKGKYKIPKGRAVKKALTKQQVFALIKTDPETTEQKKAKDFWLFSFICNGINMKDIALLKYKNLKGDRIEFERAKTENTNEQQTVITIHLTELSKSIIKKYGHKNKNAEHYIFPILTKSMDKEMIQQKVKRFTRFVNQHIKKLAKANDLPEDISTYWARHSFATLSIRGGANMEFVREAFGHQNITTTQNYFAGFEDETKKQIVESLLNFD